MADARLVVDGRAVAAAFLRAVAARLDRAFRLALAGARERIGDLAAAAVRAAPEYESLVGGRLRGELGVVDARPVLEAVLRNVRAGAQAESLGVRAAGGRLEGGFRVSLLRGDYSEVLGADGASFTSEHGFDVPWLRWLTLEGDRVVVGDYEFADGYAHRSRTGQGIMLRGGSWRVPPEFSGTADDNWILRAVAGIGPGVAGVLEEELTRSL